MGEEKETSVKAMRRFWGGLRGQGKSQASVGTETTTSATSAPLAEDDNIPLIERIKMDLAGSFSSSGDRSKKTPAGANETADESISEQSSTSWLNEESHSVLSLVGQKPMSRAPRVQPASKNEAMDTFNEAEVAPRNTSLKKKLIKVKRSAASVCSGDASVDVSVLSAMKSTGKTKFTAKELKEMGVDIPTQRGRPVVKAKSRSGSDENKRASRSKSRGRASEGEKSVKERSRSKSRVRDSGGSERGRATDADADPRSRARSVGRARSRSKARPSSALNDEDASQAVPIEIRPKSPSNQKLGVKDSTESEKEKAYAAENVEEFRTAEKSMRQRTIPMAHSNESASRGRDATEKSTRRSRSIHRRTSDDTDCDSPEKSSRSREETEKSTRRSRSVHRRSSLKDDTDCDSPEKSSRGRDETEKTTRRSRSVHRRSSAKDDTDCDSPEKSTRRSRSVHRRSSLKDEADSDPPGKSSRGRDETEKTTRRSRSVHRRSSLKDDPDYESPEKCPRGRDVTEKTTRRSRSVHRRSSLKDDPGCDSPEKSPWGRDETEKSARRSKSVHRRGTLKDDPASETPRRKSLSSKKSPCRRTTGTEEVSSPRRSKGSPEKSPSRRSKSVGRKTDSKPKPIEYDDESYSDDSLPPVPTQIVIRPDTEDEFEEEKQPPPQINGNSDEIYNKIKHAGITQEQFIALAQAGLTITNEG